MIDKVSGEASTSETSRTLDVPGRKQLIVAGVTEAVQSGGNCYLMAALKRAWHTRDFNADLFRRANRRNASA